MVIVSPHPRPFVLLTGATGLVGGLVLAHLLRCRIPVAVLVRNSRRQSAMERVEGLMRRLEERFGSLFIRPVVICGDLGQPGLGISEPDCQWIKDHCSSVIHSAANLLFRPACEHPDNEPYRTNLDGTRALLELMTQASISEWHYISTAYIAGLRTGHILESDTDVGQQFGNDYERSKTLAEQMLRQSSAVRSLTVYRPSIVIDLHATSSMRSDQTINSAFVMFQTLSQRFGLPDRGEWFRRLGFSGIERKNIVTVDWVATMIVQIYRRPELHRLTYHLTSRTGTSAAELEDAFRAAMQGSGAKLPPRRPEATGLIDEHAAPFVAAFKPYFKDDPSFDRTNITRAMQLCVESDLPALTVENLRDFCLRQTKSVLPAASTVSASSSWQRFVCEFTGPTGSAVNILQGPADTVCSADCHASVFGLELYGFGGGQWLIDGARNGICVFASDCQLVSSRVLSSAATFDELTSGKLQLKNALEMGLVVLEADQLSGTASVDTETRIRLLTEQLERLLATVQCYVLRSATSTSEVVNVG